MRLTYRPCRAMEKTGTWMTNRKEEVIKFHLQEREEMGYLPYPFVLVISSVPHTCELFVLFSINSAQFRDGEKGETVWSIPAGNLSAVPYPNTQWGFVPVQCLLSSTRITILSAFRFNIFWLLFTNYPSLNDFLTKHVLEADKSVPWTNQKETSMNYRTAVKQIPMQNTPL